NGGPAAVRDAFGGNTPTGEQNAIIDTFRRGDDMVIAALAGTGKTATLRGISRLEAAARPQRNGIYLAFNRSVADEARAEFPQNVTTSTAHALAVRNLRSTPQGALLAKLDGGRSTFRDMGSLIDARAVTIRTPDGARTFAPYPVTRMALATVEKFCTTMDTRITARHVPPQLGVDDPDARAELAAHIVPRAQAAWAAIRDPHTWTIKFTPSHVLKLWADMHPRIGREGDFLMLDEAQDASPLIASIVDDQTHMQRVRVGDTNQSIYRFTGAVDAMSRIEGATLLPLTKSWRFGPAIADAGNWYLKELGTNMRVRGNETIGSRLALGERDVDAVLCRTNGAALAEVIGLQQAGRKTALVGDIQAATRFCESAELLKQGASPRDADLAAFTTWGELQDYVENMPGASDLKTYVELVDTYGLDTVRAAIGGLVDTRRAESIASTAHKAKGLEFPRVRINHEWTCDPDEHNDPAALRDERMLVYVALTRAKETLDPGCLLPPTVVQQINRRHGVHGAEAGMPAPLAGQLL
ncbi:MAG: AAA family ATPase, partial [Tomitella sp.]|nr:AAA family ATPase [Tomitella sp.]